MRWFWLLLTLLTGLGAAPWSGQLTLAPNAAGFVDRQQNWVLPLCAHFGEAFSAYVRRPAEVEDQLRAIKAAGYDCIRFWDNLGEYSDGWRFKEVSPFTWTNGDGVRVEATPDYYGQLRSFLQRLKQIGLTAHHSRGDLGRGAPAIPLAQVVEHSTRVAAIYDDIGWDVLAIAEANNEDWQNGNYGPEGLRRIVAPFAARGALTALSAPTGASEAVADLDAYSRGASVFIVHGYRQGKTVDRLRQIFNVAYNDPSTRLGWQAEPTGPGMGVTVGRVSDVEELGLMAAQALAARQAWNYMCGPCVFWNSRIDRQPGFHVVPRMRAALAEFAPDVMSWRLLHGGRREAPLKSTTGYVGDRGVTRGPGRIHLSVHPNGRKYVAFVIGGRGPRELRNDMGCTARLRGVQPKDDETLGFESGVVKPGETFPIDYRVGRMILGECVG